ncbi:MAG TPA: Fe(2+)-trafficking protein [Chloroflexota bacterium]
MADTSMHIVTCLRCGEEKEGLDEPPLRGEIGQLVFEHTCRDCWAEWFEQSVNVINHHGINPALPEQRQQLYEIMKEFLDLD